MKKAAILFVLLASTLTVTVRAQETYKPSWIVGMDLRGSLPMGDFEEIARFGVGGTVYAGYAFSPSVAVTARTGYIFIGGKEIQGTIGGAPVTLQTNYGIIPFLGGVKFYFNEGDTRFYAAGELGMFYISATGELTNSSGGAVTSYSDSDTKFGYVPAVGVQLRAGRNMMIDAHIDYTAIPDDAGDFSWVTIGIGAEWVMD